MSGEMCVFILRQRANATAAIILPCPYVTAITLRSNTASNHVLILKRSFPAKKKVMDEVTGTWTMSNKRTCFKRCSPTIYQRLLRLTTSPSSEWGDFSVGKGFYIAPPFSLVWHAPVTEHIGRARTTLGDKTWDSAMRGGAEPRPSFCLPKTLLNRKTGLVHFHLLLAWPPLPLPLPSLHIKDWVACPIVNHWMALYVWWRHSRQNMQRLNIIM